MTISVSDLNYLEVLNPGAGNSLTGGGGFFDISINKNVNIDKTVFLKISKTVETDLDLDGLLAEAGADAEAVSTPDHNALAETDTFAITEATTFITAASSVSTAALQLK